MMVSFAFIRRAAVVMAALTPICLLAASPVRAQVLAEDFDDVSSLLGKGFAFRNNSDPPPADGGSWGQGNPLIFNSLTGLPDSFIAADFLSVSDTVAGTISNWMLTPALTLTNGEALSFYSRTNTGDFPDRLEVRLSQNGDSADVGATAESVGDFTSTLLRINPDLSDAYPTEWTRYEIALTGLPDTGAIGRIGFRYYVTDAGATGSNADYIGVDNLRIGVAAPEPPALALLGTILPFALCARRILTRRQKGDRG